MVPIAQEFNVPLAEVTVVFTMRLVGACASGWLADRVGRKIPLMISILWYSLCKLHRRLLPDLHVPVCVPSTPRDRHGRGMADRRGIGDGSNGRRARPGMVSTKLSDASHLLLKSLVPDHSRLFPFAGSR